MLTLNNQLFVSLGQKISVSGTRKKIDGRRVAEHFAFE